jgi:lipoate-protein ligase A
MDALRMLDLTLPELAANLALDEALLLQAEAGTGCEVLRLWEWPAPAVVLGSGCRLAEEVNEDACRTDAVPILRRSSGGGTVLLGPGCLLYSLILRCDRAPELAQIRSSYCHILRRVCRALGVAGAAPAGTSDIAVAGRKFSGNSQQRKRGHMLHHGSLLYAFDLAAIGRYVRPPPRQPDYRRGRSHEEFLYNLGLPATELKEGLRRECDANQPLTDWPRSMVAELVAQKYSSPQWVRRR